MKKKILLLGVLLSAISLASCVKRGNTVTDTSSTASESTPSSSVSTESSSDSSSTSESTNSSSSASGTTPTSSGSGSQSQSSSSSTSTDIDDDEDDVVMGNPVIDNQGYCHLAGVLYEKNTDNKYVAKGLEENSTVTKVIIPASIDGIDVVKIDGHAFKETNITSVDIADSVTEIGEKAFYYCRRLRDVKLSNSITKLANRTFFGCTSLTSLTIPATVTEIEEKAIEQCHDLVEIYNLSNVNVSSNLVSTDVKVVHTSLNEKSIIEDNNKYRFAYFENEYYLIGYKGNDDKITLPNTLTYNNETISSYKVYKYAFAYSSYKEITISKAVTAFPNSALKYNYSLEKIVVDNNNEYYDSRNNCNALIKKDTNSLIKACKNTIIPEDVEWLSNNAFEGLSFASLSIPNSVVRIEANTFEDALIGSQTKDGNCYYLGNTDNPYLYLYGFESTATSATINSNCKIIGNNSYRYSGVKSITIPKGIVYVASLRGLEESGIETIVFEGTVEEWNAIPKTTNLQLYGKTITCTNGDVVLPNQ